MDKNRKTYVFSDDILAIDYENEEIVTQQVYFENGLPDDRDIYCYNPDEIELMQSTDMVDRNGNIIFEGDIVKMSKDFYSEPTYYEVARHRGGAYRLEDLKKARKNLDWLIEEMEHEN